MLILYFIARLQAMLQVFPKGSSVKSAKPEICGFLMPALWLTVFRNSSTVVETIQTYNLERDGGR